MSNQAKRLSNCPAERLAHCRGEAVPPAGDVEVLRYKVNIHVGATTMQRQVVLAKDFDDHVTCLTAERDGLLANVKELTEHRDELKMQRDRWVRMHGNLQSELTKAQELLNDINIPGTVWQMKVGAFLRVGQPATPIAHNVDESRGQDAPAPNEEDWHMNPCKQGHGDVGACGGKAFCHTCDETITATTTQEAFEQWNATHPANPQ
ncbi:hypothetical protein [Pseudomonas sp. W2-17]|uniref:hypothetical protein n=1 Tax=Pseudomonas sp. W2-17 TaxID=3058039 RepID=UPI0034E0CB46